MTRIVLEHLALFFVPFVLYGAWLLLLRLQPPGPSRAHPWTVLFIAGLVLFAGSFVIWGFEEGTPVDGSVYVAPHTVDGRVVPGHFEKKPQ